MMMTPGFSNPDPYHIPDHVVEAIKKVPPPGFFSVTKGKKMHVELCGTCGLPRVISQSDSGEPEAPNMIASMQWMPRPENCQYCGPIFARYPEIALWITQFVAWQHFVTSSPSNP